MCIRSPNWYQRTKPNKLAPNMPAELVKLFISFIRRIWIAIKWRAFAYIMSTNAGRILISAHVHMPRSKLVNPSEGKQTGTTFQEGTRTTLWQHVGFHAWMLQMRSWSFSINKKVYLTKRFQKAIPGNNRPGLLHTIRFVLKIIAKNSIFVSNLNLTYVHMHQDSMTVTI